MLTSCKSVISLEMWRALMGSGYIPDVLFFSKRELILGDELLRWPWQDGVALLLYVLVLSFLLFFFSRLLSHLYFSCALRRVVVNFVALFRWSI